MAAGRGAAERPHHRVLVLPAGLATAEFYRPLLEDPALVEAGVRMAAATPPGFGGRPLDIRFGFTVEAYAERIDALARREGVDLIVAHSLSARAALEVATRQVAGRPRARLAHAAGRRRGERRRSLARCQPGAGHAERRLVGDDARHRRRPA